MQLCKIVLTTTLLLIIISTSTTFSKDIQIASTDSTEYAPAVAYNIFNDEFLVVFEDYRYGISNIFGQLSGSDGTPIGEAFPVCMSTDPQYYPDVAYNRIDNEYLVVWEREQKGSGDICGMRLFFDGKKAWSTGSLADTSIVICDADSSQYDVKVAHNFVDNCYLAVWNDDRDLYQEIYGQRINHDGELLSPRETPDSKINFPVTFYSEWDSYDPDVAYHGEINEWLVVFARSIDWLETAGSRIWAVRIRGNDGAHLDTYGEERFLPPLFFKTNKVMGFTPPGLCGMGFPVGFDSVFIMGSLPFDQTGPRNISNDKWFPEAMGKNTLEEDEYPVPEFLVCWTDYRNYHSMLYDNGDIYCQRVAYFPDSEAVALGLKDTFGSSDSLYTAVLLDSLGNFVDSTWQWINWSNYAASNNENHQDMADLTFNQTYNEYLIGFNDWRNIQYPPAPADIYGQRLYLNSNDSSLVWLDDTGTWYADPSINTPIAANRPDEGNEWFPALAHGIEMNEYLIAYEYDADASGANIDINGTLYSGISPTSVKPVKDKIPEDFTLSQNYPNPFNPVTKIEFSLPITEKTVIKILNTLGQEINILVDKNLNAGNYEVQWNGKDFNGLDVSSGIYIYKIEAGHYSASTKMILLR
jgi:hypothetical protein